jgi:adenylate cyclase
LWLPLFTPLLFAWLYYVLAALYAYWQERAERKRSVEIFSRFLDSRVVDELIARGESALDLKSESREITVLFSDIRGFTTLSEKHTAEEIVDLLNNYFSRQVEVIFRHGGTMDKFIGDAVMAFWGAPVDDGEQARHAVEAALDMADALMAFKADLGKQDENFDVGIGIHTGLGVVGFIGSHNRLDYTVIGDTVNLASRIEGKTKGVARILVSDDTRAQCAEAFDFTDHGFYKVKGRTQEVRLFEPRRKIE